MGDSAITQEQLVLLMSSHKESVELTTKLCAKLDSVIDSQKESNSGLVKLCDKIDHQTETLTEANLKMGEQMVKLQTQILTEHNSITNKIYVAFSMMGTIVIGLVTALVKIFTLKV